MILAVISIGGLAYAMLSSAVIPALPVIQHALGTSEEGVTWLLTGYLLSASVATSILGRLGDMYGKERLLVLTLVLLAVGTAVSALATSLVPMVAGRVIQGAGGGIGIVLGGLIVEHLDYHWLYWIPLIVIALATVLTWRFVPESPIRVPGRVNWTAAASMTAGFCCVLVAISETTVWGWGSVKTIALLLAGLVLSGLWVLVEVRASEPLIDMTMMRIRGVWTTNLVAFLLGAGMYAAFLIFPQFAQLPKSGGVGFGSSVLTSSLYLAPAAFGMAALGSVAGRVARRFGS